MADEKNINDKIPEISTDRQVQMEKTLQKSNRIEFPRIRLDLPLGATMIEIVQELQKTTDRLLYLVISNDDYQLYYYMESSDIFQRRCQIEHVHRGSNYRCHILFTDDDQRIIVFREEFVNKIFGTTKHIITVPKDSSHDNMVVVNKKLV